MDNLPRLFTLLLPRHIQFEIEEVLFEEFNGVPLRPSYDLGYVMGTFLGDGTTYYKPSDGGQVTWAFGLDEDRIASTLLGAISTSVGMEGKRYTNDTNILVVVHNVPLAKFFGDFGKRDAKALPSRMWCADRGYLSGLYDGLIDSDGHLNAKTQKFTNTSTVLMEQMGVIHYLLYFPSVSVRQPAVGGLRGCPIENCKPSYRSTSLRMPPLALRHQLVEVLTLDKTVQDVDTFDFEVEGNDHSFIANNVVVHNSMGSASYLLAGGGQADALESACHGAGRSLSRGAASHVAEGVFREHTEKLRIVTPVDPESAMMRRRPDILAKYNKRVMEEAPYAYKPIDPIIDSVNAAGIARSVVRLLPLCTVKG